MPEVLRRIGRLEMRAEQVVEGFLSGRHDSPYTGRSIDFRQHRPYSRGDDLRHVDWKVWGRKDRFYVKEFEEETNLRATILLDCSASMSHRDATADAEGMSKHDYASTAACVLAYLFTRQHDAVGCISFADKALASTPLRSSRSQVARIAESIPTPSRPSKTDIGSVLSQAAPETPRRSVMVLISDLLCDPEGLRQGLGLLAARGVDLVVLHVMSDDELDFPFDGPTRFLGLETDARLEANPRALRDDYLAALDQHLGNVRAACARSRADYRLIRTSESLDAVLVALLARRASTRN